MGAVPECQPPDQGGKYVVSADTRDEGDSAQKAQTSSAGPSTSAPASADGLASPAISVIGDSKLLRGAVGFE